jgi:hypothetical protein
LEPDLATSFDPPASHDEGKQVIKHQYQQNNSAHKSHNQIGRPSRVERRNFSTTMFFIRELTSCFLVLLLTEDVYAHPTTQTTPPSTSAALGTASSSTPSIPPTTFHSLPTCSNCTDLHTAISLWSQAENWTVVSGTRLVFTRLNPNRTALAETHRLRLTAGTASAARNFKVQRDEIISRGQKFHDNFRQACAGTGTLTSEPWSDRLEKLALHPETGHPALVQAHGRTGAAYGELEKIAVAIGGDGKGGGEL